jgi:hypothetical protein
VQGNCLNLIFRSRVRQAAQKDMVEILGALEGKSCFGDKKDILGIYCVQHSRDTVGTFRGKSCGDKQAWEYNTVKYSKDMLGDLGDKIAETKRIGRYPRTVEIC